MNTGFGVHERPVKIFAPRSYTQSNSCYSIGFEFNDLNRVKTAEKRKYVH